MRLELHAAWLTVVDATLELPQHAKLKVSRGDLPHPSESGLYPSRGMARRCRHYRHALPDGRGLHVHEYPDHYHVHWDAVDPSVSLARHLVHDVLRLLTRAWRGQPDLVTTARPEAS